MRRLIPNRGFRHFIMIFTLFLFSVLISGCGESELEKQQKQAELQRIQEADRIFGNNTVKKYATNGEMIEAYNKIFYNLAGDNPKNKRANDNYKCPEVQKMKEKTDADGSINLLAIIDGEGTFGYGLTMKNRDGKTCTRIFGVMTTNGFTGNIRLLWDSYKALALLGGVENVDALWEKLNMKKGIKESREYYNPERGVGFRTFNQDNAISFAVYFTDVPDGGGYR